MFVARRQRIEARGTGEEIGQIAAGHPPVLNAVLHQKPRQGGLKKAVLVPVGMAFNELAHGPQQRLRHLGPQAHRSASCFVFWGTLPFTVLVVAWSPVLCHRRFHSAHGHQFATPRGGASIPSLRRSGQLSNAEIHGCSGVRPGLGGAFGLVGPWDGPVKGGQPTSWPSPRPPDCRGPAWGKPGKRGPPLGNRPGKRVGSALLIRAFPAQGSQAALPPPRDGSPVGSGGGAKASRAAARATLASSPQLPSSPRCPEAGVSTKRSHQR